MVGCTLCSFLYVCVYIYIYIYRVDDRAELVGREVDVLEGDEPLKDGRGDFVQLAVRHVQRPADLE